METILRWVRARGLGLRALGMVAGMLVEGARVGVSVLLLVQEAVLVRRFCDEGLPRWTGAYWVGEDGDAHALCLQDRLFLVLIVWDW